MARIPRFETKPPDQYNGGGYERVRSWEVVPGHSTEGPKDVYASIHRLCALAWGVLSDFDDDRDVHHHTPDEHVVDLRADQERPEGDVPWLNVEWALEARERPDHCKYHCHD